MYLKMLLILKKWPWNISEMIVLCIEWAIGKMVFLSIEGSRSGVRTPRRAWPRLGRSQGSDFYCREMYDGVWKYKVRCTRTITAASERWQIAWLYTGGILLRENEWHVPKRSSPRRRRHGAVVALFTSHCNGLAADRGSKAARERGFPPSTRFYLVRCCTFDTISPSNTCAELTLTHMFPCWRDRSRSFCTFQLLDRRQA